MEMISTRALLAAAALCLAPMMAEAAVLTFDGPICNGTGGACGNGFSIDQGYGDMAGVDVVYDGNPGAAGLQSFAFWADSYSGMTNVAYYGGGATLSFVALAGQAVSLGGLSLGGWPNADRVLGFTVTDLATSNEVFRSGTSSDPLITVPGTTPSVFTFDVTSSAGLMITFLGDFYNGGVDNVIYGAADVGAIPLPAGAPLLGLGLGALALLSRRRRRG